MKLNLLVLRTSRLDEMRRFYSSLGAHFEKEQHGSGPEHYSATLSSDCVLELYPARDGEILDAGLRLGLAVDDIKNTLNSIGQSSAIRQTHWGLRAIVRDPDGRTIELLQNSSKESNVA